MKLSFLNKRITFGILLFCFIVTIHGQKLTVVNTTNEPLIVNDSSQEMKINANHKDDNVNQYLPQSCRKQYFRQKYKYLEHINGHNKEYYKKILVEKFNDQ